MDFTQEQAFKALKQTVSKSIISLFIINNPILNRIIALNDLLIGYLVTKKNWIKKGKLMNLKMLVQLQK